VAGQFDFMNERGQVMKTVKVGGFLPAQVTVFDAAEQEKVLA
jgi:hypothetical protein